MTRPPTSPAVNLTSIAAACALLYVFRSVLAPFVMAFVLAILIDALLRSRLLPATTSWPVRLLMGTLIGGGAILGGALVVVRGVRETAASAPLLVERLDGLIKAAKHAAGLDSSLNLDALAGALDLDAVAGKTLAGVQEATSGTVLTLLFLVFILASKSLIQAKVTMVAASSPSRRMLVVLERTIQGVESYIWVQTVTGLMIAVASGAIMFAAGLDNALFWTLALFMLSYIPVIGVAVGSVAPALFALVQFQTAWPALIIFLGVQAISFVVGNLVLPKMQAESQNIDPAVSLLATGVWTILWGAPGAFLAVPLALALMFQLAQYESLRWLAVLMSNNGHPLPELADGHEASVPSDPRGAARSPASLGRS